MWHQEHGDRGTNFLTAANMERSGCVIAYGMLGFEIETIGN